MSDEIPNRCKGCTHWLGRWSGDEPDKRCNRNFGWADEENLSLKNPGSEPLGTRAWVRHDCEVPRWGVPLPPMDENGNQIGQKPKSPTLVDAYEPALPKEGEEIRRSTPIVLWARGRSLKLNSNQLRQYLMADDKEEKLDELWENREERRGQGHSEDQRAYEDMHGTSLQVREGSDELPAWERGEEKIPTGIPQLDLALNGGLEPGVRINISGKPDAGKTTLKNALEGAILRYYLTHSRKPETERIFRAVPEGFTYNYMLQAMNVARFARNELGYEGTDQEVADRIFSHVKTVDSTFQEETFQSVITQINQDVQNMSGLRRPGMFSYELPATYRAFTYDSIDADELAEEHFQSKKDKSEAKVGEEHRVAAQARLLAESFRKLYKGSKIPITQVYITQQRASNIGSGFAGKSETRGNAQPYFVDVGLSLWAKKFKPNQDRFKEVHAVFNKLHTDCNARPGEEVVLYLEPHKGFVPMTNAVKFALDRDEVQVLSRSGSWVYHKPGTEEEIKTQGTDPVDLVEWLESKGRLDGLYDQILQDLGLAQNSEPDSEE